MQICQPITENKVFISCHDNYALLSRLSGANTGQAFDGFNSIAAEIKLNLYLERMKL